MIALRTIGVLLFALALSGCLASGAYDPTGVKTALKYDQAIDRIFPNGRKCSHSAFGVNCRTTYSNTYIYYSPRPDIYHTTTVVVPLGICLGCGRRYRHRHHYGY